MLKNVTVQAFEEEENLFMSAYNDNGEILDPNVCKRFFDLPAVVTELQKNNLDKQLLEDSIELQKAEMLDFISNRNLKFFDEELTKLDKWAEDRKNSLEIELKQLDKDIKTKKTDSKKL